MTDQGSTAPGPLNMPPLAVGEPGWTALDPLLSVGAGRSFVSGEPAGDRLRVAYFRRDSDGALVGRVWFGPGAEGPPGHAHGGSMAAVLDEAMGAGAWMGGHAVVAVKLTTQFHRMLPIGTDAVLEAWVERVDGRKVTTRGRLCSAGGVQFASAEGLFIVLSAERFSGFVELAALSLERSDGNRPASSKTDSPPPVPGAPRE